MTIFAPKVPMGRILAIDYGQKRVGLAVTDPLQIIASALETVEEKQVLTFLQQYLKKEAVDALVLGMPKRLDNSDSSNTAAVQAFEKKLQKTFPEMRIFLVDERFTSKIALQSMIAGGSSKKDRREKGNIDKVSATIILQSFLDSLEYQQAFKQ